MVIAGKAGAIKGKVRFALPLAVNILKKCLPKPGIDVIMKVVVVWVGMLEGVFMPLFGRKYQKNPKNTCCKIALLIKDNLSS